MRDEPIDRSVLNFMESRPEILIHSVRSLASSLNLRPPQVVIAARALVDSGQIEVAPSLGMSAWRLKRSEPVNEGQTLIVGEADGALELGLTEWLHLLDREAARRGYPGAGLTKRTGEACWVQFFLDGFSPSEALEADEEFRHAG